jgi:hypothetical protein
VAAPAPVDVTPGYGASPDPAAIWAGILSKHPNAGAKWKTQRWKIFKGQWPQYLAFNKHQEKIHGKIWNFWKWQNYQFALSHQSTGEFGGAVGGVLSKLAANPELSLGLSIAAPFLTPAIAAAGAATGFPAAINSGSVALGVGLPLHANLTTTPEGRQFLAEEAIVTAAIAAPIVGAGVVGAGLTAGASLVGSLAGGAGPTSAPFSPSVAPAGAPSGKWILIGGILALAALAALV